MNKNSLMLLPPTYYEFIRHLRPLLVEMAEQDVQKLLQISPSHEGIHSSDDFDSSLARFYAKLNAQLMGLGHDHPGLTEEEMAPYLASAPPQVKSFLMSLYATVNYEYHVLVNFTLAGKKTFYFSNNLSEHLANTEINLKASLIQLPFQCCQFTFTSRAAIDAMHNIRGADGRIAINRSELDYTAPVSVFLTLLPSQNGLSGRTLLINAWHARQPNSYLMLKRQLHLDDDWTLEQALRTDWENLTPDNLGVGLNIEAGNEKIHHQDDDRFYTDGLFFFRFVLNAVLYLSSEKAEIGGVQNPRHAIQEAANDATSLSRRRKLLQSMKQHTALEFKEVGASVGPIVVNKDDNTKVGGISTGVGDKLQVRFMVRGHWRRQPHGQENQERKLIWIQPHFKGPDIAEIVNKPYLVK